MLNKLIRESVTFIVGKHYEEIADLLNSKKHVNEFLIAKKLELTINQVRNLLYKLSDFGLVSSIRKKDKRKGWYTYFWKLEIIKSLEFLKEQTLQNIQKLETQIKSRQTNEFYLCERCNIEVKEENALLNEFTCNECGDIFVRKDNTFLLRVLDRNIEKFKRKLKIIEEEIEKEKDKLEKKKIRENKKKTTKKKISKKKTTKKKTPKKKTASKNKTKPKKTKNKTKPKKTKNKK